MAAVMMPNQVILLNQDYSILNIVNWRRALRLILNGRAEVVEESEKVITNFEGTKTFAIPSVIKLLTFVRDVFKAKITFSKKHVFIRDGMKCIYCNSKEHLTLDHLIPKSRGGKTTWDNIVTSCSPCNRKKGNKLLQDTNMKLKGKPPKQPNISEFLKMKIDLFGIGKIRAT